jgi:peptidoglycan/xylan/chitin deacetylase (PgdA/CDA1 family)
MRHTRRVYRRDAQRRRMIAAVIVVAAAGAVSLAAFEAFGESHPAPRVQASEQRGSRASVPVRAARKHRALVRRRPGTEPVPILMYHVIAAPFADSPYPGLYMPPAEFSAQMNALAAAGYHAVTLDQVRRYWQRGTPLPRKPIVLSFDNGYRSQYTQALPILQRHGWVGVENLQLAGLPPSQGGLSAREVRALLSAHWELDTQGFNHADLITLGAADLHHEVAESRKQLEREYHVPVNWFCYPSGHYNATVVAAVTAAGYVGATTVVFGWAHHDEDPYELPRLRVLGGTSPAELLAMVAAARDDGPPGSSYPP